MATVVVLVVAAAVAWGAAQFNRIDRVDVSLRAAGLDQPQNFLIVGSDTRELEGRGADAGGIYGTKSDPAPGGQRSDSIAIARVDPSKTAVELLSIPRDLWIAKPGSPTEHERINAAYNDGPQSLIDAIETTLKVPIHHFVEVNFDGFKGLVDAIGGVPMYFDKPLRDANTGLRITNTGCQVLGPEQALAYARSRYLEYSNGRSWVSDPTGDLGRISRQQVFLRRSLAKVATLGIGNLNTLRKLVGVAVDAVKIDSALSADDMISLARKYSNFDSSQLANHRLATTDYETTGGAKVELLDEANAAQTLRIFRGEAPMAAPPAPSSTEVAEPSGGTTGGSSSGDLAGVTLDVLNGTNTAGLAKKDAEALAAHGFAIGQIGNTSATAKTVVRFASGAEAAAEKVADTMKPSPPTKLDSSLPRGRVQLVIGVDAGRVAPAPAGAKVATTPPTTAKPAPTTTVVDPNLPADAKPIGIAPGDPPPGVTCS